MAAVSYSLQYRRSGPDVVYRPSAVGTIPANMALSGPTTAFAATAGPSQAPHTPGRSQHASNSGPGRQPPAACRGAASPVSVARPAAVTCRPRPLAPRRRGRPTTSRYSTVPWPSSSLSRRTTVGARSLSCVAHAVESVRTRSDRRRNSRACSARRPRAHHRRPAAEHCMHGDVGPPSTLGHQLSRPRNQGAWGRVRPDARRRAPPAEASHPSASATARGAASCDGWRIAPRPSAPARARDGRVRPTPDPSVRHGSPLLSRTSNRWLTRVGGTSASTAAVTSTCSVCPTSTASRARRKVVELGEHVVEDQHRVVTVGPEQLEGRQLQRRARATMTRRGSHSPGRHVTRLSRGRPVRSDQRQPPVELLGAPTADLGSSTLDQLGPS